MIILLVIPILLILFVIILVLAFKKKWIYFIIAFLIAIILNIQSETFPLHFFSYGERPQTDFTVLVYNVHGLDVNYKEKQVDIAKLILSESPDIAFLCEFPLYRNYVLDSILTKENRYTQNYETGTYSVFYSKYEIDSIAGIHTSISARKQSLNNKVHIFVGEDTLTIVGCHLSSSNHHVKLGYQKRKYEADAIYNNIKDEPYPIIVMGDLNDISGSYAVERIKNAGLKDAWWKKGLGYGATFHDKWIRLRLDHILYQENKLELQYVKVIDSDLSDHYALVAGFTLKK